MRWMMWRGWMGCALVGLLALAGCDDSSDAMDAGAGDVGAGDVGGDDARLDDGPADGPDDGLADGGRLDDLGPLDGGDGGAPADGGPLRGLTLEVRYDGERTGSLVVGVFESYPPMGPPAAFTLVPTPVFPTRVTLPEVAAGDYEALVFIDAAPVNPMTPGPEDAAAVVSVSAPGAATVELVDGEPVDPPVEDFEVVVGERVGPVRLGMTYAELTEALGMAPQGFGMDGAVLVNVASPPMVVALASPDAAGPADDARVMAVQANGAAGFSGAVRPGMTRAAVEAEAGAPHIVVGDVAFHPAGIAVIYGEDEVATSVAVWPSYEVAFPAPEMLPPAGETGGERPVIDPAAIGQVDMHLHFGEPGQLPESGTRFTTEVLPPFLRPLRPGILRYTLAPFAPFLGIRAQVEAAGSDHAVLFAVYTQESAGYATNRQLEAALTDPRNVGPDGLPWAWGLGSVNFYDGYVGEDGALDEAVAASRLAALGAYFEAHPSLFIGIKLAHAHQGVAFDDPRYLGVYDVAAEHDVPLYLHTGLTPFPGASNTPPFYDPAGLDGVVASYPAVRFVLGHVGQGDARSVENALRLAAQYDNVWLEISALGRPLVIDADGEPIEDPEAGPDQLAGVMAQILERGLVDKAIFGTDGPQGAGAVPRYTALVIETMRAAGYDDAQQAAVMGGNFARVFFPPR